MLENGQEKRDAAIDSTGLRVQETIDSNSSHPVKEIGLFQHEGTPEMVGFLFASL